MKLCLALPPLVLLAACSREPAPDAPAPPPKTVAATPWVHYACADGRAVSARYPDSDTAQLQIGGAMHVLKIARSGSGARYVGERFIDNGNSQALPAYTVFDASLGWNCSRNVLVQLNLRNLADKVYAVTSYSDSQYLLGERRHAEVTVQWRF